MQRKGDGKGGQLDIHGLFKTQMGIRFKEFRKSLKLSLTRMAEIYNIKQSRIEAIEKGAEFPPMDLVRRLAVDHKLDCIWLLTGLSGPPTDPAFIPLLVSGIDGALWETYCYVFAYLNVPEVSAKILADLHIIRKQMAEEIAAYYGRYSK